MLARNAILAHLRGRTSPALSAADPLEASNRVLIKADLQRLRTLVGANMNVGVMRKAVVSDPGDNLSRLYRVSNLYKGLIKMCNVKDNAVGSL